MKNEALPLTHNHNFWLFLSTVVLCVLLGAVACNQGKPTVLQEAPRSFEYKVVYVSAPNHERTGANALLVNEVKVEELLLNTLGKDGWDLSASWLELETSYPNLGDSKYVTGIQPNIRPQRVVLLFKRTGK